MCSFVRSKVTRKTSSIKTGNTDRNFEVFSANCHHQHSPHLQKMTILWELPLPLTAQVSDRRGAGGMGNGSAFVARWNGPFGFHRPGDQKLLRLQREIQSNPLRIEFYAIYGNIMSKNASRTQFFFFLTIPCAKVWGCVG